MEYIYTFVGWILIGTPIATIVGMIIQRRLRGTTITEYGVEMKGHGCGRGVNLYGYCSPEEAEEAGRQFGRRVG